MGPCIYVYITIFLIVIIFFCLILNRLQLSVHYVHLGITNGEDVAVHGFRARGRSFDLKMHAIFGVDKPRSVAVQCCVGHRAQIDKQTKLIACDKFGQIHVRPAPMPSFLIFIFALKEPFDLGPHVFAVNTRVVNLFGLW